MSDHGIESQPNEWLVTTIKNLQNDIREMRTLQTQGTDAVNVTTQNYSNYSYSYPPGYSWLQLRFTNTQGHQVFGNVEFTFYQGSVSPANIIDPAGGDPPGYFKNWDILWWQDYANAVTYGDNVYGVGTCVAYNFSINNLTAGALTMVFTGRQRLILSTGTTTS